MHFSSVSSRFLESGYECKWEYGDGLSSDEIGVTGNVCANTCMELKKTDSSINGVSVYSNGDRGCWCMKKMTKRNTDSEYKSCFLEPKGTRFIVYLF